MGDKLGGGGAAAALVPGFRFHPTDEELVQYYLKRKASGRPFRFEAVAELDVYKSEPWELEGHSKIKTRDLEWYFFNPVDRKYGFGVRLNRKTGKGFWKSTGKERRVCHKGQTIGMKKTFIFHTGKAPDGERTDWVMYEYRLVGNDLDEAGADQVAYVLCKIFHKSRIGPSTGDRYAPFVEEEWDDDKAVVVPGGETDEEMIYVDYAQAHTNERDQDNRPKGKASPRLTELPNICENAAHICERERSEDSPAADVEPFSVPSEKPKHSNANTNGNAYCSEGSTTTVQDLSVSIAAKKDSSALLEFPLLEPKEKSPHPLPASNLEKSVPPGYLEFISKLESEAKNVSTQRENLKIELMRAQAVIDVLKSRVDHLDKEKGDLVKRIKDA